MSLVDAMYRVRELLRVTACRLRVHAYRFMGAHIHPKCLFGKGVRLEHPWRIWMDERCVMQPDVWLNVGGASAELRIGAYTFVGRGTEIEVAKSVAIGKFGLIAPGVFITDHNHGTKKERPMFEQPSDIRPVTIGDDVWIGANAVILAGVHIGDGAVVGAGAVVTRDVEAGAIVGGVPARFLRWRE